MVAIRVFFVFLNPVAVVGIYFTLDKNLASGGLDPKQVQSLTGAKINGLF
jgi:hypothetical protein